MTCATRRFAVCSPFHITIEPGVVDPHSCRGHGKGTVAANVGQPTPFAIDIHDKFGNPTVTPLQSIYAVLHTGSSPESESLSRHVNVQNAPNVLTRGLAEERRSEYVKQSRAAVQGANRLFDQLLPSCAEKQTPSASAASVAAQPGPVNAPIEHHAASALPTH
jgi:hypothetical protein